MENFYKLKLYLLSIVKFSVVLVLILVAYIFGEHLESWHFATK